MNEQKLQIELEAICKIISDKLESIEIPVGCCFLFGHVLAEGLSQAGFEAKEISGTLILADKNDKKIIYGSKNYKGKNVGDFHTWCVVVFEGKEIIVDPSLKFNQYYLKQVEGIKLSKKVPEIYVGFIKESWHLTYIEDVELAVHSKDCLKGTAQFLKFNLIKTIKEAGILARNN